MKKIVYITGCLGFIGSYITRLFLNKGWYVRGIDKMTYASNPKLLDEFNKFDNFIFEKIDINDLNWLYDCDYIINTAAETHVDNSIIQSKDFLHSNIDGVHNLLELIKTKKHFKMPTLIHFSTDEVYGDILDKSHIETDILNPSNPYSATKAAADQLILAWHRTHCIPYIIVRPTNNYGIGQYVEKLIPKTCKFISIGRKIPLHDSGNPIRNWLHAHDTALAIYTIINKGEINTIYNISGNYEQSNRITVQKILNEYFGKIVNVDDFIDFDCVRVGQDLRYSVDWSKLNKLGWQPLSLFDSVLPLIVKYYKNTFVW